MGKISWKTGIKPGKWEFQSSSMCLSDFKVWLSSCTVGGLYSSNTLEAFQDFYPKLNQSSVDLKFLSPPTKEMRESKAVLKKLPGKLWTSLEISEKGWKYHGKIMEFIHSGQVGTLDSAVIRWLQL